MPVTIDGTAGVTAPNLTSTTSSTLASMTQALNLGSTGQIVFPATQNASSDANTLDDYEEGTWTPTVSFAGSSTGITYSNRIGTYTKIGNMVYASAWMLLSNKGSSSGGAWIGGLPFSLPAASGFHCIGVNIFSLDTTRNTVLQINYTSSIIEVKLSGSDANLTNTEFTNSTDLRLLFFYRTT